MEIWFPAPRFSVLGGGILIYFLIHELRCRAGEQQSASLDFGEPAVSQSQPRLSIHD